MNATFAATGGKPVTTKQSAQDDLICAGAKMYGYISAHLTIEDGRRGESWYHEMQQVLAEWKKAVAEARRVNE